MPFPMKLIKKKGFGLRDLRIEWKFQADSCAEVLEHSWLRHSRGKGATIKMLISQLFITKSLKQTSYEGKRFMVAHGTGGSQTTTGQVPVFWPLANVFWLSESEAAQGLTGQRGVFEYDYIVSYKMTRISLWGLHPSNPTESPPKGPTHRYHNWVKCSPS